jgi:amidophosphoribosyltransferase
VQGAYSLIALHNGALIGGARPLGVRPLVIGKLSAGGIVLASETWRSTSSAPTSSATWSRRDRADRRCGAALHEAIRAVRKPLLHLRIHLLRAPRLDRGGHARSTTRGKRIGAELARESGVAADVIVPVPDSGVPAAMGYAAEPGCPTSSASSATHYVGRTFIEPTDQIRHLGVKLKHIANRSMLEGKRVVLVDDSIVRGTTSRKIVEMVRAAARRRCTCASPPRPRPIPASTASTRRNAASCWRRSTTCGDGADHRRRQPGLHLARRAVPRARQAGRDARSRAICDACFTGDYAIPLVDQRDNAERPVVAAAAANS